MSNVTNLPVRERYDPHALPKLRRSIGGETYDTSKATVVFHHKDYDAEEGWGIAAGSYLLTTRAGRYFIVGYCDADEMDSPKMMPVTTPQAIAWAEKYCTIEEQEAHFGEMPEAGFGTPYVAVRKPPKALGDLLAKYAAKRPDDDPDPAA